MGRPMEKLNVLPFPYPGLLADCKIQSWKLLLLWCDPGAFRRALVWL